MIRTRAASLALLPLLLAAAASAQEPANPGLVGALGGAPAAAPSAAAAGRISRTVRQLTGDGELSGVDFEAALEAGGDSLNADELSELRAALSGKVSQGPDFTVSDEARRAAIEALFRAELFPASREALAEGRSYAGTELPAAVREVVARAKLHGAVAYDVTETNSEGEGKYTEYPSITPATRNMAFAATEITPESLRKDKEDTGEHLRMAGTQQADYMGQSVTVGRYTRATGGTGSVESAYDEAYHPVDNFNPFLLKRLGYPEWLWTDFTADDVGAARSSSGVRWASNCAILSDGTLHCLPAVRRHSDTPNLILTNPALARGHQLLWHGHIRVVAGKVVYIGTAGRISKRAAEGKDVFLNPIPLLRAWGFEIAEGLRLTSEHGTAEPTVDDAGAVIRAAE